MMLLSKRQTEWDFFSSNFGAFLQYLNFISHKVKIVHEVNSGSQTQEILLTWG